MTNPINIKMQAQDGQSADLKADNIAALKALFPEIITENKIDFTVLKQLLGEEIDESEERYSFTWNGKAKARRLAQTPSTGTLRPCKEESKNWDTTQNIFIEGDNLEVLKLLQKSYHQKVKMIYIDPPYNTGKDFIYPDDFRDNIKNYLELTGQTNEEGKKLTANAETSGRYHTNWLNMMYPRLKLARNLLRDDGIIFVSLDDVEVTNLRLIMNEIFGEENFVELLVWKNKYNSGALTKGFSSVHEYILCYSKTPIKEILAPLSEEAMKDYKGKDSKFSTRGGFVTQPLATGSKDPRPNLRYPIVWEGREIWPEKQWLWSKERVDQAIENDEIVVNETNGILSIRTKQYMRNENGALRKVKPLSLMIGPFNQEGTKEIDSLFGAAIFDFPKPSALVRFLASLSINAIDSHDDIILDFFSGSASTAHAVMQLNAEQNSSRKFIMVQLPESTDQPEYPTIADIGKERIRRTGEKILTDNADKLGIENLDIGFKVFKLDSSNIKSWDADFDTLSEDLLNALEVIKPERTADDVLFEILLKYGLDLSLPVAIHSLAGKTVFEVGAGALLVCLDKEITEAVAEAIGQLKTSLAPAVCRVVFRDAGFADDAAKVNAVQVLKQFGIEDVKSL